MECSKCGAVINNDAVVCSQCNKPLESKQTKKKVCFLVKLLLYCTLAIIALAFLANSIDNYLFVSGMFGIAIVLLVTLPFLAIAALIRINLQSEKLKGRIAAILILVFSCFFIYELAYYKVPRARQGFARGIICGTNLRGIGKALLIYANDHNDMLPDANQWCDLLVVYADVSPRQFICPYSGAKFGESSYILNKEVVGMKLSEIPPDMVLIFETNFSRKQPKREAFVKDRLFSKHGFCENKGDETIYKDRWNQVGGPELLSIQSHIEGCNILYADMHTKFEKTVSLPTLKWTLEGKAEFVLPKFSETDNEPVVNIRTVLITLIALLSIIITVYILFRYDFSKYWSFIVLIALLSTIVGMFFGNMSEDAYVVRHGNAGWIGGAFFGLLVGICFAVLLANSSEEIKSLKTFRRLSSSVGMLTGIVCSTLVHVILIIVYKETNLFGIIIGIPYGIAAGSALGYLSGFVFSKFYLVRGKINT